MSAIRCITKFCRALLLAAALVSFLAHDSALAWSPYTLTNGNSRVTVNPDSPSGMSDWTVDGQTQLYNQSFWYRKGSTGGEKYLGQSATLATATQVNPSVLNLLYNNGTFTIETTYSLLGGVSGSGSAAIGEQISINNLTAAAMSFHFFQYVDFDLGGTDANDTITLERNFLGKFVGATQRKGNAYFADEIISPSADRGEVSTIHNGSQAILNKLLDGSPTTLNNTTGPITGDASWAFQWDINIPANSSYSIDLTKSVYVLQPIPEPSLMAIVVAGASVASMFRRRRAFVKNHH